MLAAYRRTRSEESFRALYRACTPRLYGFALRLSRGDAEAAGEIVQSAWVRCLDRMEAFRPDGDLARWLNGIAVNCWREFCRSQGREAPEETAPAEVTGTGDATTRWLDRLALQQAVDRLPAGYHEVLLLHDVEGYTHEEIADLLSIAPGTSKSQLSRARRALRLALSV